jgi:hypothetical protein
MPMTAAQRSMRGRLGAHTLHSTHDSTELTVNGRKAFMNTFEAQVDPEGILSPEERSRRAQSARKAHMTRLALLSSQARSSRTADKAITK